MNNYSLYADVFSIIKGFHNPFIFHILALFPPSTQSLAELWGLMGMAIANTTPNRNEQPTELSRFGGFGFIQFSKPE